MPADIQLLVEGAINKIEYGITVIPYNAAAIKNKIKRGHTVLVVHGGITEYDSDTESENSGLDVGFFYSNSDISGSESARHSISSITLDFSFLDLKTQTYIPGLQVSNSMKLNKRNHSNGLSFSIYGNGLGINGSATKKDGIHSVIRLLVELSMVELIGRHLNLPYWFAINDARPDRLFLSKLEKDFNLSSNSRKIRTIQKLLNRSSETPLWVDGVLGPQTKEAIAKSKILIGISPYDSEVSHDYYLKLLEYESKKIQTSNYSY